MIAKNWTKINNELKFVIDGLCTLRQRFLSQLFDEAWGGQAFAKSLEFFLLYFFVLEK
jgi:hypothetical protein